jgi:hypothetical protein
MYALTFTEQQLLVIDRALQEMPFKVAAPILGEINRQLANQEKNEEKAVPEKKEANSE